MTARMPKMARRPGHSAILLPAHDKYMCHPTGHQQLTNAITLQDGSGFTVPKHSHGTMHIWCQQWVDLSQDDGTMACVVSGTCCHLLEGGSVTSMGTTTAPVGRHWHPTERM